MRRALTGKYLCVWHKQVGSVLKLLCDLQDGVCCTAPDLHIGMVQPTLTCEHVRDTTHSLGQAQLQVPVAQVEVGQQHVLVVVFAQICAVYCVDKSREGPFVDYLCHVMSTAFPECICDLQCSFHWTHGSYRRILKERERERKRNVSIMRMRKSVCERGALALLVVLADTALGTYS